MDYIYWTRPISYGSSRRGIRVPNAYRLRPCLNSLVVLWLQASTFSAFARHWRFNRDSTRIHQILRQLSLEDWTMSRQRELEHLFVQELRQRGALEDVICEYGIETIRECNHCHRLMREGWLYANFETYCSDKCLMAAHPAECIETMRHQASEDDAETCWMAWEGRDSFNVCIHVHA